MKHQLLIIIKKISYFVLILLAVGFFLVVNQCGIEDTLTYFQEPRNINIDTSDPKKNQVKFYGFNQEQDGGEYLFVGYDIYYYFSNPSQAKKAMVRNPNIDLSNDTGKKLLDFSTADGVSAPVRFPSPSFNSTIFRDFYQYVSIPVTLNMIETVLKEGNNDNVRFTFHRGTDNTNDNVPFIVQGENYLKMEQIYPDYAEYKDQLWGSKDPNFDGFYDKDYYENLKITPNSDDGTKKEYIMYFYIIAKGFNSNTERNMNFMTSISSETRTISFFVEY